MYSRQNVYSVQQLQPPNRVKGHLQFSWGLNCGQRTVYIVYKQENNVQQVIKNINGENKKWKNKYKEGFEDEYLVTSEDDF